MAPTSNWRSCNLVQKDRSAIDAQLATLSAAMSAASKSNEHIQAAVAEDRSKLGGLMKTAWATAKQDITTGDNKDNETPSREPMADGCGNSQFGEHGLDLSNVDYLARADDARQRILAHDVFKGILDELPLVITGSHTQRSGVQDRLSATKRFVTLFTAHHCATHSHPASNAW